MDKYPVKKLRIRNESVQGEGEGSLEGYRGSTEAGLGGKDKEFGLDHAAKRGNNAIRATLI